jgi:hypothetical protein
VLCGLMGVWVVRRGGVVAGIMLGGCVVGVIGGGWGADNCTAIRVL